jgi:hypothetical protein
MLQVFRTVQRGLIGLALGVMLTACSPATHRPPPTYNQSLDSASNACARYPAHCPELVGQQVSASPAAPVVRPPPKSPPPSLSGSQRAALNVAAGAAASRLAIDATLELRIREALSQCADDARSTVILKHFGDRGPTREECNEVIGVDARGEPITRAMQLGNEQHALALRCAEARLKELKPGGFSISPRYRIDPQTGHAQFIPREQVQALLAQGRSAELLGSIEPDIVIHAGHPHQVQLTFDFKFPCVNGGNTPWRKYPEGHPHHGYNQRDVYERALGVEPLRILPRRGVMR